MWLLTHAGKIAFLTSALAVAWRMVMNEHHDAGFNTENMLTTHLATLLQLDHAPVRQAYTASLTNVKIVLRRQYVNTIEPNPHRPLCNFDGEQRLAQALGELLTPQDALFTLARVYDEAHITLCSGRAAARRTGSYSPDLKQNPHINLDPLTKLLRRNKESANWQIVFQPPPSDANTTTNPHIAVFRPMVDMTFSHLPKLASLSGLLPGEHSPNTNYAGIGGGGGSDIISASLLGHLLREHSKEMNLLISTRTWATGSQGRLGSKMGIKREVYNHGGQVTIPNTTTPIPGTFRVSTDTQSEGRDLEAIPVPNHSAVYIVLDQSTSSSSIPPQDRAKLNDQFHAVLFQPDNQPPIDTVAIVDTGGDVFGTDPGNTHTTPDQDLRVQQAMCSPLFASYNLLTVVIAPGVDAPIDAPQKAAAAGGMVYTPTKDERAMLLKLLRDEYKMDGSIEGRFGKTTLALQARLKDVVGWTSLDLPAHIVDTWENPWSSFVYIRDCMEQVVVMPTRDLLPLIEPSQPQQSAREGGISNSAVMQQQ